jgi:hypothetical protein
MLQSLAISMCLWLHIQSRLLILLFCRSGVYRRDNDTKVSKHVAVYITQRYCCDIYLYNIIVHLLVIIKTVLVCVLQITSFSRTASSANPTNSKSSPLSQYLSRLRTRITLSSPPAYYTSRLSCTASFNHVDNTWQKSQLVYIPIILNIQMIHAHSHTTINTTCGH